MFFQINCGNPLELERLPTEEVKGGNLTGGGQQGGGGGQQVGQQGGGGQQGEQQQKLSPPTPFADTNPSRTNASFSEQSGGKEEEISGDATGMPFPSNRLMSDLPNFPSNRMSDLPNPAHHFSPANPSCQPGETEKRTNQAQIIQSYCFRI